MTLGQGHDTSQATQKVHQNLKKCKHWYHDREKLNFDKTLFQNVFVTLLRRVARDVTSSLLSWHKRYDFKAGSFRRHSQ